LEAQDLMRDKVRDVRFALMMATTSMRSPPAISTRHGETVCIDINPAVVTKLTDREPFKRWGYHRRGLFTELSQYLNPQRTRRNRLEPCEHTGRMMDAMRLLMCSPDYYGIEYEINLDESGPPGRRPTRPGTVESAAPVVAGRACCGG
jgi:hypothetical protein